MPSNDNLTIKFGQKSGTGNTAPINSATKTPGSIYVAKNSVDEIEMYLDTPEGGSTERKRLDPRIFVGALPAGKTESQIWNNYDVWIDTSGDPTGVATTTTNGLMSSINVNDINDLKDDMATVKSKINGLIGVLQGLNIAIKKGPWTNSMGASNTLTIVMPSDWGGTEVTFNPDGGITQFTTGGNGS